MSTRIRFLTIVRFHFFSKFAPIARTPWISRIAPPVTVAIQHHGTRNAPSLLVGPRPTTRRVTRQTRRTPSLSPPPHPKRGRGGRRGRGRGGRTAHQRDDSPAPPDAARNQPDPPQTPEPPAPRASSMQPSVVIQPADTQAAAIQAISDQLARMQQEARNFQAAAARDRESDRQEMIRRTTTARPTASDPSQGPSLAGPSTVPQAPRLPGPAAPPQARTSKPSGSTNLLPDGEELFSDFCPPQFAVPSNSAGEEQLRRAGLDPHLLQQMTDPASALRAHAHSSKQANLILRGVGLADPATTGGLTQKATDNPPLTAQWPHKKVWLAKTGHWAEYDHLSIE